METAGIRGKTPGGRERTMEEPGEAKEDRRGMEAVTGGSRVTITDLELEELEELEDVPTVCWRPVLMPAPAPVPRYSEPVLPAAPSDVSDKLLN